MKIEITIETIQTETIVQLQSFEPAPENLGGGGYWEDFNTLPGLEQDVPVGHIWKFDLELNV